MITYLIVSSITFSNKLIKNSINKEVTCQNKIVYMLAFYSIMKSMKV